MMADGQSYDRAIGDANGSTVGGLGGGSGGTILLFLEALALAQDSYLSVAGGNGVPLGGGGGGGGRLHFHWSNIDVEDEYVPLATINGTIYSRYTKPMIPTTIDSYFLSLNNLLLLVRKMISFEQIDCIQFVYICNSENFWMSLQLLCLCKYLQKHSYNYLQVHT